MFSMSNGARSVGVVKNFAHTSCAPLRFLNVSYGPDLGLVVEDKPTEFSCTCTGIYNVMYTQSYVLLTSLDILTRE